MGSLLVSLYALSAFIAFALLVSRIFERCAPNSHYFSLLTLALFLSNLGYLFEVTAQTQADAIMALRLRYVGAPFITPFLLMTVLIHCGKEVNWRKISLLLAAPFATAVFTLTWPANSIIIHDVSFLTGPYISRLILKPAAFYYIYQFYNVSLILAANIMLVLYLNRRDRLFKRQSILLIIASLPPILSVIYSVMTGGGALGFDPSPLLLGMGCVLMVFSYLKFGFYRVAPIARDHMVETMSNGYIIMDADKHYIDANLAAKRILPKLATISAGSLISEIEDLAWLCESASSRNHELHALDQNGADIYYRVSETEVKRGDKVIGRCIMLFEITEVRQLLDEVSRLAERDELTNLYNRRSLYIHGVRLFDLLMRSGGNACMLMIDIDDFKNINDTLGHLMGDEVLKSLSNLLTSRFRATDLVTRYGGEEFCVFLPNMPEPAALDTANRLRERTSRMEFTCEGTTFNITISIGLTAYDSSRHRNLDAMIADADMALYAAKNSGKNAVFSSRADPLAPRDANGITLTRYA